MQAMHVFGQFVLTDGSKIAKLFRGHHYGGKLLLFLFTDIQKQLCIFRVLKSMKWILDLSLWCHQQGLQSGSIMVIPTIIILHSTMQKGWKGRFNSYRVKTTFPSFLHIIENNNNNCILAEIESQRHLMAKAVFLSENKSWRSLQKLYCHISVYETDFSKCNNV